VVVKLVRELKGCDLTRAIRVGEDDNLDKLSNLVLPSAACSSRLRVLFSIVRLRILFLNKICPNRDSLLLHLQHFRDKCNNLRIEKVQDFLLKEFHL
jgi:hypothetical protein